MKNDNNVK